MRRIRLAHALIAALALAFAGRSLAAAQATRSMSPHRASELVRSIELVAFRVQRLLGALRGTVPPSRVRCVDARLSEINSMLRQAIERRERAGHALVVGDRSALAREHAIIARLADEVRQLERKAFQCGEPDASSESGRTRVLVTVDAWAPPYDAAEIPTAGGWPSRR
jgi:hypothetical protein